MPEAFHARFPVLVKSLKNDPREKLFLAASPLVSSAFGQRRVAPTSSSKLLVGREKKPLVPRVRNPELFERFGVPLTVKGKREFVPRAQVFPLLFYPQISSFT